MFEMLPDKDSISIGDIISDSNWTLLNNLIIDIDRSSPESPSQQSLMPPEAIKLEQPPPALIPQETTTLMPPVTSMDSGPPEYQLSRMGSAFSLIPPSSIPLTRQMYVSKPTRPTVVTASVTDYRDHHNVSPASTSIYQPPASVGLWPHNWQHPDDESSVSPPHYRYVCMFKEIILIKNTEYRIE